MDEYVARVSLTINGREIDDFTGVSEETREIRKEIKLMRKTGVAKVTPRYGGTIDYVVPEGPEFDFEDIQDGTLTIEYDGGRRIEFSGVAVIEIGETKFDGENGATKTIKWIAQKRSKS